MGYPHNYNTGDGAERSFIAQSEDEQRSQLRAEIFRQLQEQDHQQHHQEQEQKQDDMFQHGTRPPMMDQLGGPGIIRGGFGTTRAPANASSADSTQAEQQLVVAEQAIQLGVTPEMLELVQRHQTQSIIDDTTPPSRFEGGQVPSYNRRGGGGVTGFAGAIGGDGGSGRPHSLNSAGSIGGPGIGSLGGSGFGTTTRGISGMQGAASAQGVGGGYDGNLYGTNTQDLAANLAQEAELLRQKSQQLQERQAKLMAAAQSINNDGVGSGMAILPNQSNAAMATGGRLGFAGCPSFLEQKVQTTAAAGVGHQDFVHDEEYPAGVLSQSTRTMPGKGAFRPHGSSSRAAQFSKKRSKTFPEKLMQAILEEPNEDIVAWLPDGKSFVVVDPEEFVEKVLKKEFKGCKYSSFVRKLHRWDFVRLTSGTGTDCFHHPLFRKGRHDLCLLIKCAPRHGSGGAAPQPPTKSSKDTFQTAIATKMIDDKPPSLAGVEKFISSPLNKKISDANGSDGSCTAA